MDSKTPTDNELYDVYVKLQRQLWERWMEIARQFEEATAPETAWWSYQFKVLDQQAQGIVEAGSLPKVWLRLWKDSLDQHQGVLAAMLEWNRRITEHRAEANRQFLAAWSEAVQGLNKTPWDISTQQSFEALQDALKEAIDGAADTSATAVKQGRTPVFNNVKRPQPVGKRPPAVRTYPH